MTEDPRLAIEGGRPMIASTVYPHRHWPEITDADRAAVLRVLDSGTLAGTHAPATIDFQFAYARAARAQYALLLNSGTAALHGALVGAGVGPGDDVIVPAYSFAATALAVLHAGARPVFCDIDMRTGGLDPAQLPQVRTPDTRAVLPVHIDGIPCDMDPIAQFARDRGLAVIEDAAQVHGARYKGRPVGTIGDAGAFSLSATKNLGAGEGGILVTNDHGIYEAARRLGCFGESVEPPGTHETRAFWSEGIGYQYRAPEITAALARSQLLRLDAYNANARENARALIERLEEIPGVVPPCVPDLDADEPTQPTWWKFRVLLHPPEWSWEGDRVELRDRVLHALKAEGVPCGLWQRWPLPDLPVFRMARPAPWNVRSRTRPSEPLAPRDLHAFPQARELLDCSIVLGTEHLPLYVQHPHVMRRWCDALEKIWIRREALFSCAYEPFQSRPEPMLS